MLLSTIIISTSSTFKDPTVYVVLDFGTDDDVKLKCEWLQKNSWNENEKTSNSNSNYKAQARANEQFLAKYMGMNSQMHDFC